MLVRDQRGPQRTYSMIDFREVAPAASNASMYVVGDPSTHSMTRAALSLTPS